MGFLDRFACAAMVLALSTPVLAQPADKRAAEPVEKSGNIPRSSIARRAIRCRVARCRRASTLLILRGQRSCRNACPKTVYVGGRSDGYWRRKLIFQEEDGMRSGQIVIP